jgi:MFS family permease
MRKKKPLIVVFQTIFLDLLGFGIILPLLPLYAERFGASPFQVTAISASYSLMQFLFVPLWGRLSDRIGRRPILLISIAGAFVSYTIMGFTRSLIGLLAARILSGIAGANLSAAQAVIADVTKPEERAKGMGLVGAAFGLGFIFGPFIGGTLSSLPSSWLPASLVPWKASLPFFAAGFLALVNWFFAFSWLAETRVVGSASTERVRPGISLESLRRALAHPRLGWLIGLSALSTLAFANMEAIFVLWGERTLGMTGRQAGWLFAYIGILMVTMQGGLIGWFAKRFGESRLVVFGTMAMSWGLLLAPLCGGYLPLLIVLGILALGGGLAGPAFQSLISRGSSAEDQGGVLGLTQSLASLARVVGPLGAGYTFGLIGISAPWLIGGSLMALACGVATVVLLYRREEVQVAEAEERPA